MPAIERIKCCGLRFGTASAQCRKLGKYEHDWFCGLEHLEQAKKYASATAYAKHIDTANSVSKNPSLIKSFNEKIRTAFSSIIEAGKQKEEADFLLKAGYEYTSEAVQGWKDADDVLSNDSTNELNNLFAEVNSTRSNMKRKYEQGFDFSVLETVAQNADAKRVKTEDAEVKPEPEDAPAENAEYPEDEDDLTDEEQAEQWAAYEAAYAAKLAAKRAAKAAADAQAGPSNAPSSSAPIPPAATVSNASHVQFAKAVLTPLPDNGNDMDLE
jgi:hypothetical protein